MRPPALAPQLRRDPLGSFPEALVRRLTQLLLIAATCAPCIARGQSGTQPILAADLLGPQKVALEGGMLVKPIPDGGWWPTATAGLGWAGGQISLGVARRIGPRVNYGGPGAEFTVRLQASLLRTWGEPRYVDPRRTYGRVELTFTLPLLVGIRAGAFHPLDGTEPSKWAATFGLVLGWH